MADVYFVELESNSEETSDFWESDDEFLENDDESDSETIAEILLVDEDLNPKSWD